MELALCLEKLTNEKLLALHKVAEEANDPQMTDFIEGNFLEEQVGLPITQPHFRLPAMGPLF
jgi:ferritin heavy chain